MIIPAQGKFGTWHHGWGTEISKSFFYSVQYIPYLSSWWVVRILEEIPKSFLRWCTAAVTKICLLFFLNSAKKTYFTKFGFFIQHNFIYKKARVKSWSEKKYSIHFMFCSIVQCIAILCECECRLNWCHTGIM